MNPDLKSALAGSPVLLADAEVGTRGRERGGRGRGEGGENRLTENRLCMYAKSC